MGRHAGVKLIFGYDRHLHMVSWESSMSLLCGHSPLSSFSVVKKLAVSFLLLKNYSDFDGHLKKNLPEVCSEEPACAR